MNGPSLFISHGSPLIAMTRTPVGAFLKGLGSRLPRPRAIVCVSAHWETWFTTVTGSPAPSVIYDFTGPRPLYEMTYPAPGDPSLAVHVAELLSENGIETAVDANRGFDHGVWVPLRLMFPEATVPVVQLSLRSDLDGRYLFAMGRALQPLREEGVLILASGGGTAGRPIHSSFMHGSLSMAAFQWD